MRYFIVFALCSLLLLSPAPAQAADPYNKDGRYSQAMPDIPLMDGMIENAQARDKRDPSKVANPNMMSGNAPGNAQQVKSYYSQQLRDAGWKQTDPYHPDTYTNADGDTMSLDVQFNGNGTSSVQLNRTLKNPPPPEEPEYVQQGDMPLTSHERAMQRKARRDRAAQQQQEQAEQDYYQQQQDGGYDAGGE